MSCSSTSAVETATERALSNAVVLDTILEWIHIADVMDDVHNDILSCMVVNKTFFTTAAKQLWRHPINPIYPQDVLHLPSLFDKIEPERRQFYAKFMQEGSLWTDDIDMYTSHEHLINGIQFPALHKITLKGEGSRICPIEGHKVRSLILWSTNSSHDRAERHTMDELFDAIVAIFPTVEEIVFDEVALVFTESFKRFRERLPRLQRLDHDAVKELDEDAHDPDPTGEKLMLYGWSLAPTSVDDESSHSSDEDSRAGV